MHKLVRQQVAWIWIAALAILFGALAPAISHALAASAASTASTASADQAMQVCTMEGMRTMPAAANPVDKQAGKFDPHRFEHFLEHCPYCALHASPALLPAPALSIAVGLASAAPPAPPRYASVFPHVAWTPAAPRGPPASI